MGVGVGVVFNGATDGLGRFYELLHEISTSFLWISATVGNMFQVSKKQKLQILNIKIKTDECSYIYKSVCVFFLGLITTRRPITHVWKPFWGSLVQI